MNIEKDEGYMPPARPDDLAYGHLGEAKYDPRSEKWHFRRIPGIRHRLQPISERTGKTEGGKKETTSLDPALQDSKVQRRLAATRYKQTRELIKYEPILAPAAFLLPALAQVSEAVIDATSACDSAISTLISFGTAIDLGNRDSELRTVEVVAIAGGPVGEAVRIFRLRKVQARLDAYEDSGITHWAIDKTEQGFWVGRGSPIQQVCFSEDKAILQPVVRRLPVPPRVVSRKRPPSRESQPLLLDSNPIVDLPIHRTGNAPHTDITFNPWDQNQLAVLDTNGRWSIWNLEERSKPRTVWTVRAGSSGNLPGEEEDASSGTAPSDSWGIILWVSAPDRILIAKRKVLVLLDTTTGTQQILGHGLGLEGASEWIFDVKRNPEDPTQLFVLTSSCIFWLRVTADEDSSRRETAMHVLLARRHFRSHEDRSLQISLCVRMKGILVVVYSRSTELATVFTFAVSSPLQLPQSTSDPFMLHLRDVQRGDVGGAVDPQIQNQGRNQSTLCMWPLKHPYSSTAGSDERVKDSFKSPLSVCQLYVLHKDLGVSERLYILVEDGRNLKWNHLAQKLQSSTANNSRSTMRNSFIVPDALVSDVEAADSQNEYSEYEPVRIGEGKRSSTAPRDSSVLDLRWLATTIEDGRSTAARRASSAEVFAKVIDNTIAGLDPQTPGIQVLLERFPGLPMDNVDDASSLLQTFVNGIDDGSIVPGLGSTWRDGPGQQQRILQLSTPSISSAFQDSTDPDSNFLVLATYETLLNRWISSLGSSVPGRTRVGLEKHVRQLSIELYLSLHGLYYGPNVFATDNAIGSVGSNDEINLPFRRRRSAESLSQKSKESLRSSSPLRQPTTDLPHRGKVTLPIPKPTTSQTSQPPETSSTASQQTPYERLKTLVPLNPQPSLSGSMSRLVDQWEIGQDPNNYDWDNKQHYLSSQSEADGPDAESIRRRRERREKRLKRHHQEYMAASSQADSRVYFSSQPQVPQIQSGSSQVRASKVHPSSQFTVPIVQGSSQSTIPTVQESNTEHGGSRGRPTKVKKFTLLGKRKPGFG